jgi:MFS family permease
MKASVPRVVWVLGLVSLCMDLSSEMIHSLLPVFLVSVLGAGTLTLGLVEGVAEGTALISKVFSGVLSDRFPRRKPLVVLGYGLAAVTKPLFPLATSAWWVLVARLIDRVGKGIRGSPRDALVADSTPRQVRGAAYGLRQSLDTAGAFLGPLAAIVFMQLFADDVRLVFWIASVPAFAAIAVLVAGVKERPRQVGPGAPEGLSRWSDPRKLDSAFWAVTAIGAVVTLARFSEAFLVLRANEAGLSFGYTPLVLVIMNATYVASAYPAGLLSDRVGRVWLLAMGLGVLIVADVVLAFGEETAIILAGVAVWGLHMGLTQGVFAALVADVAPAQLRGTAFGLFNFVSGIAAIAASLIAGGAWEVFGPAATFGAGALFSVVALVGLAAWQIRMKGVRRREKIVDGPQRDD